MDKINFSEILLSYNIPVRFEVKDGRIYLNEDKTIWTVELVDNILVFFKKGILITKNITYEYFLERYIH